uniref:Uncharacterized protein n=1 Tax=Schistocephalus solidus TaxID=70667 RepID=A0A0V0JCW3_SCHSO
MRYYFSLNILLLGQLLLLQKSEGLSKTICQWNSRKIVSTSGYYTLTTLRASNYQNGYINGQPFGTPQHSLTECIINGKRFPCYYKTLYGLDVTTLEFTDITDIDSVVINSTYPVTVHRVKKPAHSTKIRKLAPFILDI